jgi:hypothetical protein
MSQRVAHPPHQSHMASNEMGVLSVKQRFEHLKFFLVVQQADMVKDLI